MWPKRESNAAAVLAPARELKMVKGATHYFEGQPDLLAEALDHMAAFVDEHVGPA